MKPEDFQYLCDLLKSRSGLMLSKDKSYLIENRLMPILRKHALKDIGALADILRTENRGNLAIEVTEAMTTNESLFFRDSKPFDLLKDVVLPHLLGKNAARKKIRIWSAACANGQEPYSLAMLFEEMAVKLSGWRFEIIATDISTAALSRAEAGVYSQFEIQRGLPIQYLVKYFDKQGDKWRVKPGLKHRVAFKYFNLLDNLAPLGCFDVIFCRNVLIYFDQDTKSDFLDRIAKILVPDGYLFLGGAETVLGISEKFRPTREHRGLYVHADHKALGQGEPWVAAVS